MAEEVTMLDIDLIQIDPEIQIREVHTTSILGPFNLFKEIYRLEGPKALPPVVVYHDADGVYWLADGHYRVAAAREVFGSEGAREIPAKVRIGSKRHAILFATSANGKHGQRLTLPEMRIAVQRLLQDPEWGQWSDREIARHVGVSHVFVGKVREVYAAEIGASGNRYQILPASRIVRRGHRIFPMKTSNINRARGKSKSMPLVHVSLSDSQDAPGDDEHELTRSGLHLLKLAWQWAEHDERRAFREWLETQPDDDAYELIEISTPEIEQIRSDFEQSSLKASGGQGSIHFTQRQLTVGSVSDNEGVPESLTLNLEPAEEEKA